ncbi:uncharacterized protein LOC127796701 [Diospyros lotus]|uniref:uncharacterized protein LOC127796701 n=1 Tax=Diospyros lotus TaxID=55363 RepID=UPI0022556342|nr:uncharacterized protein LOC127796701 [Diospyros lotus]
MRTLWPSLEGEDGLETVLEVPIPEEMFGSNPIKNGGYPRSGWHNMKSWVKPYINPAEHKSLPPQPSPVLGGSRSAEIQLLLGVVGAPLVPLPISSASPTKPNVKDHAIEASMAKYIVQQYIAATGGEKALNAIDSMYAVGKVKMGVSEFVAGDGLTSLGCNGLGGGGGGKVMKIKGIRHGRGEVGGFVLWQKRPELWCLELVVSGCKISAGSDGKVAWRQTPWHHSHASRGPPRPLRRSLQGLDPRTTANLFSNSVCIGEKIVNGEDCFVLKLEAETSTLRARSSSNVEIIGHTVWGYFSQRTGLLVQLEDSHLLRIKAAGSDSVFWETSMESQIQDYRAIDGVVIAHRGRTAVSLFRYGESSESQSKTEMEEVWSIEEVDFNIKGLSMDCFLPPGDLKKEEEGCGVAATGVSVRWPFGRVPAAAGKVGVSKVVAIDDTDRRVENHQVM